MHELNHAMLLMLQATHLENKDDREVVCSEIFVDITGLVDDHVSGESRTLLHMKWHMMYLADTACCHCCSQVESAFRHPLL